MSSSSLVYTFQRRFQSEREDKSREEGKEREKAAPFSVMHLEANHMPWKVSFLLRI